MAKMNKEAKEFEAFLKKSAKKARGGKNCPKCKGEGHFFVEKFMGNDSNDEPCYYNELWPCDVCKETITRIKKEYR
jgi:hypothetical protein